MNEHQQPPTVYQYKVSLETNQKYVQPQITVYANDFDFAINQAVGLLQDVIENLKQEGFMIAPIKVEGK
jgi:hypothetical protein